MKRTLLLSLLLAGCSYPTVTFKPGYDAGRVKRVALLGFTDFPGRKGSGEMAASVFETHLLQSDYQVVERQQVRQLMKEQSFSLSGAVDAGTVRQIGHLLGVDAVLLGDLTDFRPDRERTQFVNVREDVTEPVIRERAVRVKEGNKWTTVEQERVQGYHTKHRYYRTPQTQVTNARVGLAVRLVDVETGEVIWAASDSREGDSLEEAAESVSKRIMRAVDRGAPKLPKKR